VQKISRIFENVDAVEMAHYINATNSVGNNAVMIACEAKNVEMLEFLVKREFDVNHQNFDGETAAHICSRLNIVEAVEMLDADTILRDRKGQTALHVSCMFQNFGISELMASEANVNILNLNNESPIFFAKTAEAVNLFISLGADLKIRSRAGHTPLLHHCHEGNTGAAIAILVHCLANGINVDGSDVRGRTFIHICAHENLLNVLQVVTKRAKGKASISRLLDMTTQRKNTALHLAAYSANADVARLLLELGCNPCQRNSRGYTPADISRTEAIRELIEGTTFLTQHTRFFTTGLE
jgi:uncharacterized protein